MGPDGTGPFKLVKQDQYARLRKAYVTTVAFMQAQVGRVLDALDEAGFDPWIIATGDHGYALGENGEWAKQNLFETGTRVPYIVAPPKGDTKSPGGALYNRNTTSNALVEQLDFYPTIMEALGVPNYDSGSRSMPLDLGSSQDSIKQ